MADAKREFTSWSDVWTYHVKKGRAYEEASFRADEWERKRKTEINVQRSQLSDHQS